MVEAKKHFSEKVRSVVKINFCQTCLLYSVSFLTLNKELESNQTMRNFLKLDSTISVCVAI